MADKHSTGLPHHMVTSPSALRREVISEDLGSGSKRGTKAELSQNISALRSAPQEGHPTQFSPSTYLWAENEAASVFFPDPDVGNLLLPSVPSAFRAAPWHRWVQSCPRGGLFEL